MCCGRRAQIAPDLCNFVLLNAVAGKRFPLRMFSRRRTLVELLCQTALGRAADGLDAITQASKLLVSKMVRTATGALISLKMQPPYRAKQRTSESPDVCAEAAVHEGAVLAFCIPTRSAHDMKPIPCRRLPWGSDGRFSPHHYLRSLILRLRWFAFSFAMPRTLWLCRAQNDRPLVSRSDGYRDAGRLLRPHTDPGRRMLQSQSG